MYEKNSKKKKKNRFSTTYLLLIMDKVCKDVLLVCLAWQTLAEQTIQPMFNCICLKFCCLLEKNPSWPQKVKLILCKEIQHILSLFEQQLDFQHSVQ